jgi:lipopolysaccharide/colanic/teichoic acid biosynthesis glycosyltransferase
MNWGHPDRDKVILFFGDMALVILAAVVGWLLRPAESAREIRHIVSLLLLLLTFLSAFYVFDLYNLAALNGLGTILRLLIACSTATVLCGAFFYFLQWQGYSYGSLELFVPILSITVYLWRRLFIHSSHRFGSPEKFVVIGSASDAKILSLALSPYKSRYRFEGLLDVENAQDVVLQERRRTPERLTQASTSVFSFHRSRSSSTATAVAVALEPTTLVCTVEEDVKSTAIPDLGAATSGNLLRLVAACDFQALVVRSEAITCELAGTLTRLRFEGIRVYSLPDFYMKVSEELPLGLLSEFWLCIADGFDILQARVFRRLKRLTDILLASAALLLALPLILAVAIAIRLDSPGPVLFRQRRVGWLGRHFEVLKFRSMRNGAENDGRPQWAIPNDPRITAVGRTLRKLHLDEVPQMINILRGQMSFVGPRPERPEFVEQLSESIPFYHLRHYVLPGITGWAQVNYPYGASIEDARRKLQYDLYYVRNASPLLDLRTLLRTVRIVLFRQGSR